MNAVDAGLALVVVLSMMLGWSRGLLLGIAELATLVLGLIAAFAGYRPVADWLAPRTPALGPWLAPVVFLAIYVLAQAVVGAGLRRLLRRVPRQAHAHAVNRALGLLPGAVSGLIHATVLALLLLTLPLPEAVAERARESVAVARLTAPAERLEEALSPVFEPAARTLIDRLMVEPESDASIRLRFTVADPRPRPDLEARMLELVNAERASQGLRALKADPELAQVARAHSRDMFGRGYFSHVTPEGRDPFERMRRGGVRFLAAGENLALAPTLSVAHRGLMESPGHRANILKPAFGRLGIGIVDGGVHGLMVTQKFRN